MVHGSLDVLKTKAQPLSGQDQVHVESICVN